MQSGISRHIGIHCNRAGDKIRSSDSQQTWRAPKRDATELGPMELGDWSGYTAKIKDPGRRIEVSVRARGQGRIVSFGEGINRRRAASYCAKGIIALTSRSVPRWTLAADVYAR